MLVDRGECPRPLVVKHRPNGYHLVSCLPNDPTTHSLAPPPGHYVDGLARVTRRSRPALGQVNSNAAGSSDSGGVSQSILAEFFSDARHTTGRPDGRAGRAGGGRADAKDRGE